MVTKIQEDKIQKMFNEIPYWIREDLVEACLWARETLTNHEGSGHLLDVTVAGLKHPTMMVCSFAKPEWPGDHCSRPMATASEAVCMAVCEYLNGA